MHLADTKGEAKDGMGKNILKAAVAKEKRSLTLLAPAGFIITY